MENPYTDFFDNILSRCWIGESRSRNYPALEASIITDIYLNVADRDKIVLLGKTEKFYFILECLESKGFKYSNALFNSELLCLIYGYKNREVFTNGLTVENFINRLLLNHKLQNNLESKKIPALKARKFKI